MPEIQRYSMREQCYSIIKEKILKQEYELGDSINIVTLSNELSVSNTPIREALSQLEADGLVTSSLNSKVQVISFDDSNFRDMTQTINILLSGAYDLCVKDHKIELLISLMESSIAKQKEMYEINDFFNFIYESIAFDKCILIAEGNQRLLSVFVSLSNVLFLMYRTNYEKNEKECLKSIEEHSMILEAVKAGKHTQVKNLLEQHYNKSLKESD